MILLRIVVILSLVPVLFGASSSPGMGRVRISVQPVFPVTGIDTPEGRALKWDIMNEGLQGLLVADLANATQSTDYADCDSEAVAWGPDRDLAKKEIEFQKSPWVTPETREAARKMKMHEPNIMVDGFITITDAGPRVTINVKSWPSGQTISTFDESYSEPEFIDKVSNLADKIMKEACKPKSFNVKGTLGPLQYNEMVCDITRPFTLLAKGSIGTIKMTLKPSGDGDGSVSAAGTAAFAQWKGTGSYVQAIADKEGAITMTITFSGRVAGHATATTTTDFPATLTAIRNCAGTP